MIKGKPITYLKIVVTFDILLQFIESNMIISINKLRNELEVLLYKKGKLGKKENSKRMHAGSAKKSLKIVLSSQCII